MAILFAHMGTECFEIAWLGKAKRNNINKEDESSFIPGIVIFMEKKYWVYFPK